MFYQTRSKYQVIDEELARLQRQERNMQGVAMARKTGTWKNELEKKIPPKVSEGLHSAFRTGFAAVFNQGRGLIEKTYHKESIAADHVILDYAMQVKGSRRELRQMQHMAGKASLLNMALTTVEGVGLGAFGIGLPDIVLFLSTLLKGVYETALYYGFDYESPQEQLLILKLLMVPLARGEQWVQGNAQVDRLLTGEAVENAEEMCAHQLKETAGAFAMDMLALKFVQGLPVVGILGGAANPVYYGKIMQYVQLKYRKRFLLKQRTQGFPTVSPV